MGTADGGGDEELRADDARALADDDPARQVAIGLARGPDTRVVENLWPLYAAEVAAFVGGRPNRHGLFGVDDEIGTLAEQAATLAPWFAEPEHLFPYVVRIDGAPAGFNLVATRERLGPGIDADVVVHEFFVLPRWRGRGVAERLAQHGFDRHPGAWEVVTDPGNVRALAFWRRTIDRFTGGDFTQAEVDHAWGAKVAFRFTSTERAAPEDAP